MWTLASFIAASIRAGGCGAPVCGFMALRAIAATIWRRFASWSSWRCSVVTWTSPFWMISSAIAARFRVWNVRSRCSAETLSPFFTSLKT